MFKLRLISILAIILLSQSCGFHLVNSNEALPICINGTGHDQIKKMLKTTCSKKSYQLEIKNFSFSQSGINSSANANLRQTELHQYIIFDLLDNNQKPIGTDVTLTINKPMLANNNAILSSNLEQELIQKEMKRSLINQLRRYLRSKLK